MKHDSKIADDVARLLGKPPYDSPANFCWNDNYFAAFLNLKYGEKAVDAEIKKQSQ